MYRLIRKILYRCKLALITSDFLLLSLGSFHAEAPLRWAGLEDDDGRREPIFPTFFLGAIMKPSEVDVRGAPVAGPLPELLQAAPPSPLPLLLPELLLFVELLLLVTVLLSSSFSVSGSVSASSS